MYARWITALAALLAVVAIAAASANPAAARPRGLNGKIVTNSDNLITGEEQVYTVDPDGSDFTLLENNSETGQWSHDGNRIAIGLAPFGGAVLTFDTGAVTGLNLNAQYPGVFLGCGVWSADDARLACEGLSDRNPAFNGIYTVRSSDGSDLRRVTFDPGGDDCPGDYSPNDQRIAFLRGSFSGPPIGIFTVRVDGSGMREIAAPVGFVLRFNCPSWSPQRNEIVFSAFAPDGDYRSTLWMVHANGSGLHEVPICRVRRPGRRPKLDQLCVPDLVARRAEDPLPALFAIDGTGRPLHRQRGRERPHSRDEHARHRRGRRPLGDAPAYALATRRAV
jgi:hypothetical protein